LVVMDKGTYSILEDEIDRSIVTQTMRGRGAHVDGCWEHQWSHTKNVFILISIYLIFL
jgi:hypothetical protein